MTLQSSGVITLDQISVEANGVAGQQSRINYARIRALIGKASATPMNFAEWYGATAAAAVWPGDVFLGVNTSGVGSAVASYYFKEDGTTSKEKSTPAFSAVAGSAWLNNTVGAGWEMVVSALTGDTTKLSGGITTTGTYPISNTGSYFSITAALVAVYSVTATIHFRAQGGATTSPSYNLQLSVERVAPF